MGESARFRLKLLGGFDLSRSDGSSIVLPTRKSRLMLAYLAMPPGQVHPRAKLASMFWSDSGEEQARGSLRNALSAIRVALDGESIVATHDAVSLAPGAFATDVGALEHAADPSPHARNDLLALYRGEFLEGCDFSSDTFDAWLQLWRTRCRELAQSAFERSANWLADAGHLNQARELAQRLVSIDPLREQSHRLLMTIYERGGERSKAEEQYQALKRVLASELNVEPSAQSQALARSLRAERKRDADGTSVSQPETAGPRTIAVLPFASLGREAEEDHFADGICEDIMTALSKSPGLSVIARTSASAYKGKTIDYREVRQTLGVRYFVEGSIRRSANQVRVNTVLVDARTGAHVWAEKYDRLLLDVFEVQDDIARKVASALSITLGTGDGTSPTAERTSVLEAYEYFLRGRQLIWRFQRQANAQARALLRRATELDPRFAPAQCFLSLTHSADYGNQWTEEPDSTLELARRIAETAVTLDPNYPYAQWTMAGINLWRRKHEAALASVRRALELSPGFAEGYAMLGFVLHYSGRSEEALPCFEQSMTLDPSFPDVHLHFRAQSLFQLGRYEEAIEALRLRLIRNPETDVSRVLLAACYGQLGRHGEAREAWEEVFRVNPGYSLEYRRRILPYKHPAEFEHIVDGLRKSGLVS